MKTRRSCFGLSLLEVIIACVIFNVITLGFVSTYKMTEASSKQGAQKVMTTQTLREAMIRLTPIISSACPPPQTPGWQTVPNAIYAPDPTMTAALEPTYPPAFATNISTEMRFWTTREYAHQSLMPLSPVPQPFNPLISDHEQYQMVRLFFLTSPDASMPGGSRATLCMNYPGTNLPTQILARDLFVATGAPVYNSQSSYFFRPVEKQSIVVRLVARRYVKLSTNRVDPNGVYFTAESRFFVPYYTNTPGGGA